MYWKIKKLLFKIDPMVDEVPWMTYKTISWLENKLKKNSKIFEWGSGGSTIFFSRRSKTVVSVEHNESWYSKLNTKIKAQRFNNVNYFLIKPRKILGFNKSIYLSSDESYRNMSFEKYCSKIKDYNDNYFDFVVVDGRARVGCLINSLNKVKPGGYILFDNSERSIYQKIYVFLKKWKKVDFFGPGPLNNYPWKTTIFQKNVD